MNFTILRIRQYSVLNGRACENHVHHVISLKKKTIHRCIGHTYYYIHPEKMKQIVKERDGQVLCNYFGSEKYRKKLQEMMEMEKKRIFEELPAGKFQLFPIQSS